ncbi:MAG: hypothetical protein WC683_05820 [bacterium]
MRRVIWPLFWFHVYHYEPLPKGYGFVRYAFDLAEVTEGGYYAVMPFNVLLRFCIWLKWKMKMPRWFGEWDLGMTPRDKSKPPPSKP